MRGTEYMNMCMHADMGSGDSWQDHVTTRACELMCHVGHASAKGDVFNQSRDRDLELQVLTSPRVRQILERGHVHIITVRDFVCEYDARRAREGAHWWSGVFGSAQHARMYKGSDSACVEYEHGTSTCDSACVEYEHGTSCVEYEHGTSTCEHESATVDACIPLAQKLSTRGAGTPGRGHNNHACNSNGVCNGSSRSHGSGSDDGDSESSERSDGDRTGNHGREHSGTCTARPHSSSSSTDDDGESSERGKDNHTGTHGGEHNGTARPHGSSSDGDGSLCAANRPCAVCHDVPSGCERRNNMNMPPRGHAFKDFRGGKLVVLTSNTEATGNSVTAAR
jgi:hypothetical protein